MHTKCPKCGGDTSYKGWPCLDCRAQKPEPPPLDAKYDATKASVRSWKPDLRETLVQRIDGMAVRPLRTGKYLWHVWERLSDGVQVQASMGDEVHVNGPEISAHYRWTGKMWVRDRVTSEVPE